MKVFVFNRFVEYECAVTPQTLYAICTASKEGEVHALIRLNYHGTFAYFNVDKVDMERTFTEEMMKNIACPTAHVATY